MVRMSSTARARLPDSAFAYVDARGRRRLPIHDEAHVRNALGRVARICAVARGGQILVPERTHDAVPVRASRRLGSEASGS